MNIAQYTQQRWGREQRNQYLIQLDQTFHLLAEKPATGKACDAIKAGYRKHLQGNHVVFYMTTGDGVRIIRILHKSMDVEHHLWVYQ